MEENTQVEFLTLAQWYEKEMPVHPNLCIIYHDLWLNFIAVIGSTGWDWTVYAWDTREHPEWLPIDGAERGTKISEFLATRIFATLAAQIPHYRR